MPSDRDRPKVLLVDDDALQLKILEKTLLSGEFDFLVASTGKAAIEAALRHDIAVILLDVQLPDMDGFETAKILKRHDRCRAIPIIFLTGVNKEQVDFFRGYAVGAVDYMIKPFVPHILRAKVNAFVELKKAEIEQRELELSGEEPA